MEYNLELIEEIINKKLRKSQILLTFSICISVLIVFISRDYVYWSFYFALLACLALPNINRCKKDLFDYKKNDVDVKEGIVLDMFPETEETGKWFIFLKVDTETIEFLIPSKPENILINDNLKIFHTKILQVPVKIEKI